MSPPSSATLAATLQALRGESDVHVVAPALWEYWLSHVLALASNVNPIVGALGMLVGRLPDLLPSAMRDSPALAAAVASLIGTDAGQRVLPTWVEVAPIGWGATHAAALIDTVQHRDCDPWVAAALIGPCDASAALLTESLETALAIQRWGRTTPDAPTAWMDDLTPAERDRLLDSLRHAPDAAARCLPWLPVTGGADVIDRIGSEYRFLALNAYTAASSVARERHADILSTLMQRAEPGDLDQLVRLAIASRIDAVWAEIVRVLRANPWSAVHVVAAAPWDALRADVQKIILSAADTDDICAAIAFARGGNTGPSAITQATARAFFATVTPEVWNTLSETTRYAWHSKLDVHDAPLAVRSLGTDPTFLACAVLNNNLASAVRHRRPDVDAARWTLLPIAVRYLPIAAVPDIVAALPNPPDPVAFVQIAGGMPEMPPALHDWIVTNPTPQALVAPITVLLSIAAPGYPADRYTALAQAFARWSSEETTTLLTALPDDVRAALRPDSDALADALAHPDWRDAFRKTLNALAALPPAAALPASHALTVLMQATNPLVQQGAGEGLAQALRDHGRIFADIARTLDDVARFAVLPRRGHPHDKAALDPLAVADPLVAHHMAHALWAGDMPAAIDALMAEPLDETPRRWRLLPDTIRSAILGDRDALLRDVAAPGHADALAQALRDRVGEDNQLPWLALRMLIDDDAERRTRGAAILAQRPDVAAALLPFLPESLHTALVCHPCIAFASADLPLPHPSASARRRQR
jgi:hypothetical protein